MNVTDMHDPFADTAGTAPVEDAGENGEGE